MSAPEEKVRTLYERFNADDVEGAAAVLHPDVVLHDAPELPDGRSWRGRDEVAGGLANLREMFAGPHVTVEEVRGRPDLMLALVRARGRGSGSGVPIEAEIAHVFTVRDGELVEVHVYLSHDAALEATGL